MKVRGLSKRRWAAVCGVVVAVPLTGLVVIYALLFRGSNVAPLSVAPVGATHAPVSASTFTGTLAIKSTSTVGYRVRERLGFAPAASDAVGRTSAIVGTAQAAVIGAHLTLTAAHFEVDVSQLQSDDQRRDRRLHSIGLESDAFPSASFKLTSAAQVPDAVLTGAPAQLQARGDLMLHGVTRSETITVTAQEDGNDLDILGSLTFPWADFQMTAPNVGGFVTIQSDPTLEFKIVLQRA